MSDMETEMYNKLKTRSANWKSMAYDLGFNNNDVEKIAMDHQFFGVDTCLRVVCADWAQKHPGKSLKDVDDAINNVSSPGTRYNRCHWFRIFAVACLLAMLTFIALVSYDIHNNASILPIIAVNRELRYQQAPAIETTSNSIDNKFEFSKCNIPVHDTIADALKHFNNVFVSLLSRIQTALNKYIAGDKGKLEVLGRYLSNCFNVSYRPVNYQQGIDQIDALFLQIKQFINFMDTSLLIGLDDTFLKSNFSSPLTCYKKLLDQFMESTLIINLTELDWAVHAEKNNTLLVLKLGHNWNDKNLKNLQKFKKHVFGADASLMRLISIHHSILTVIYELPKSLYQSVLLNVRHHILFLQISVLSLSIEEVVLFKIIEDAVMYNDTSEALFTILSIEGKDEQFYTSLIHFLVDIGANVNYYSNCLGFTPLMMVIDLDMQAAIVTLLELNADPNIIRRDSGLSPLIKAAINNKTELVETLLEFKANPNIVMIDINATTPLLVASRFGYSLIVNKLLEYGADPKYQSLFGGFSALHLAVAMGHNQCVDILLEFNADPNAKNHNGVTPLHYAIYNNQFAAIQRLLLYDVDLNVTFDNATFLHLATELCQSESVEILLSTSTFNVNAAFKGTTPLSLAICGNCSAVIRLLLKYNADPMVYDSLGRTSLHTCIVLGYIECVRIHLEFGVDPNTRTKDRLGYTPLLLATRLEQPEIMKILLDMNAKVNTHSGFKTLFYSKQDNHWPFSLVNMLYCNGLSPLVHSVHLGRIDLVNLLLEHGADPNSCTEKHSALGKAVVLQHFEIINVLLEHGASVNGLHDVFSPIFLAVQCDLINVVKLFLDHGADINMLDRGLAVTPLMIATLQGNIRMVDLLLKKGANVSAATIKNGILHVTVADIVNYELEENFGYSLQNMEISRRYLTIKKLLSYYEKKQKLSQNDLEQTHSETSYTHSANSSIYELVYEVEYVLKNYSTIHSHIGRNITTLTSVVAISNFSYPVYSYSNDILPKLSETIERLSKSFPSNLGRYS